MSGLHDGRNWHEGDTRCEGCGVRPGVTHLLGCSLVEPILVIDAEELEAAKNDPEWRAFCEKADEYLASVSNQERSHDA